LWRGDVEMSKKLTEKSLEKKLHNMGTEELIQIYSLPWIQEDNG
jgi:hypothetical protein